jgi:hypothetical protein
MSERKQHLRHYILVLTLEIKEEVTTHIHEGLALVIANTQDIMNK